MIPKPVNKLSSYPIRKLRGAYPWTCKQFRALRAVIHDADERYLDKSEKTLDQSPAQWKKFKLKIVTEFPEIEEFEGNWPLFVILSADRKNEKQVAARNARRRSAYHTGHRRMYVGKPLPRRTVDRRSAMAESSCEVTVTSHEQNSIGNQPTGTGRTPAAPFRTEGSCQLTPNNEEHIEEHMEVFHISNDDAVGSHFTGAVPAISHHVSGSDNPQIMAVCQNKKPLIDALALLGIINDKHLLTLNKLRKWGAGPVEFFDGLPDDKLPDLYKVAILNNIRSEQFNALSDTCYSSRRHDHHRQSSDGDSPPLLQALLNRFDAEELMPLFHVAHVMIDEEFMMLQGLDQPQRLGIFSGEDFAYVRPFQRWVLDFILRHIDMTE